jgi:hypothetical protein
MLRISATFCTISGVFGSTILVHLVITSSVANTEPIGVPFLHSKATRASWMVLRNQSEQLTKLAQVAWPDSQAAMLKNNA